MTAHVLLNPAARGGRTRDLRQPLERALADAGIGADVIETTGAADVERLARALGESGGVVIVAGGDGTVHDAVNGLAGTDGTLGVLPLGTGNDLALALGMPADWQAAVPCLASAPIRTIDIGRVRWQDQRGEHRRAFVNCLGMGFDAHAAALASETKWIGGRAAYLAAVLRTLWAWRRPDLQVRIRTSQLATATDVAEAEGLDFAGPLFLCEVGNGHSVGGGFLITPDARLDDGLLDVCRVRHLAPLRALQLLPKTFTGSHLDAPEVAMARTPALTLSVESASGAGVAVQADGELLSLGAVEVEVEVEPGALQVLAPRLGPA